MRHGLVPVGGRAGQPQQRPAVRQRQAVRLHLVVRPGVGERLQHPDRLLEQPAVTAEPPLLLQDPHPLQGDLQRVPRLQARGRADGRELAVGAAQQVQRAAPVAGRAPLPGLPVQHPPQGRTGPRPAGLRRRTGRFARLAEQRPAALQLPQPQQGLGQFAPEHGVGAAVPFALGGVPQQLHRVDEVLHHAVGGEPAHQRLGAAHRLRGRRASGALQRVGRDAAQRDEPLQDVRGDLGERLRHPDAGPVGQRVGAQPRHRLRGVRAPAAGELRDGERGEVRAALAEPLLHVRGAVLEDQQRLVPAQRSEQHLLDALDELVPRTAGHRLAVRARQQPAEQHLRQLGRAGAGQHRALHELHHRQAQRCGRQVDGELRGAGRGGAPEAGDDLGGGQRVAGARRGRRGLVGAEPADGSGYLGGAGAGEQPRPRREGARCGRQHGHRQRARRGLRGVAREVQRGGVRGALAAAQDTVGDGQPGAGPHALRQRLEDGERALPGQPVQQPVGVAAAPQGARAVADQDGDPAPRGVAELVGGA
ncbi:hypothetical protein C3486_10225 [Streptomyces sp. Ru73]|nr:hypothetical protein C3486_10225 [Streptomyces sp. Ru73]